MRSLTATTQLRGQRARQPFVEALEGRVLQSRDFGQAAPLAQTAASGLSVDSVVVLTTPSGPRRADLTVTVGATTSRTVVLQFRTVDGTALAGRDYGARARAIRLAGGQTVAIVSVPIAATNPAAPNRWFTVRVAGRVGGQAVRSEATVTVDNQADSEYRPTLKPITTAEELDDWTTFEKASDIPSTDPNVAAVPLAPRLPITGPPSMAGFDLQGDVKGKWEGWQYDPYSTRWSQGGTGKSADGLRSASNIYNFSFWQYLDISYYFGHELVTLPPTMWTDAAHANGVLSLGTLDLNRGNAGQILNPATADQLANTMSQLATYYGFDGFLVNYEPNEIKEEHFDPIDPNTMLAFLSRMRASGLTVLWYDSQLSAGDDEEGEPEDYANYLNPEAIPYLEAAGNFQANYWWGPYTRASTEITPEDSYATLVKYVPAQAETLRNDVYSALYPYEKDQSPWRYGPRFFRTLNSVRSPAAPDGYYTGVGIFAPNWTYYSGKNPGGVQFSAEEAQARDQAFWTGTGPVMAQLPGFTRSDSVAGTVDPRSVINSAPFSTDFDTGEGSFYKLQGVIAARGPWSDLTVQSILPTNRFVESTGSSVKATAELEYTDAYNGGSSLVITAPRLARRASAGFNLFSTAIAASAVSRITMTVKAENGTKLPRVLATLDVGQGVSAALAGTVTSRQNRWVTLSYRIPSGLAGTTIQGVGLAAAGNTARPARLDLAVGQMRVLAAGSAPAPALIPEAPASLLNWASDYNPSSSYRIYGVIGRKYYLVGVTRGSSYATQGIIMNRTVNGYTSYLIQEVTASGAASALPGPLGR
jgi:endo-beta-N-acetylglucosaminidase D